MSTIMKTAVCVLVMVALAPRVFGGPPDVQILSVSQAGSGSGKAVVVQYRYRDVDGGTVHAALQASSDNGATWSRVPVNSVSGSTTLTATATWQDASLTWSAGLDWPEHYSDRMRIKVMLSDGGPVVDGEYLMVDLSNGASSPSYPVSYLSAAPGALLTDPRFKKERLLLRRIPASTFSMGSPLTETVRDDNETQHTVSLTQDFYIGVFEVTQKQYVLVTGSNPSAFGGDMRPVEQVSWDDDVRGGSWPNGTPSAETFMGLLRTRTGLAFDLPTESQWEYACRAGTSRAYNDYTRNGGEGADCLVTDTSADANLEPLAWYEANSISQKHHDVGTKRPNAWGLFDMHGNVWEWCLDWYGTYPAVGLNPVGAASGSSHVIRGGSWNSYARRCRSAMRIGYHQGRRESDCGFRTCYAGPGQ